MTADLEGLTYGSNLEIALMEYGDIRSLLIDSTEKLSLGKPLDLLMTLSLMKPTSGKFKMNETFALPPSLVKFSELLGRAILFSKN